MDVEVEMQELIEPDQNPHLALFKPDPDFREMGDQDTYYARADVDIRNITQRAWRNKWLCIGLICRALSRNVAPVSSAR